MTTQELLKEARKVIARMGAPRTLKGAIEVLQMLRAELAVRNLKEERRQGTIDDRLQELAREVSSLRAGLAAEIEKREKATRIPGQRCSSCEHEGRSLQEARTWCMRGKWECAWDAPESSLEECEKTAEGCGEYERDSSLRPVEVEPEAEDEA